MKRITEKILNKLYYLRQNYFVINQPESVYFYTFHKCASSLFSKFVLKNIEGLYHVNYASDLWAKPNNYNHVLKYKKKGFIYGPIRLSSKNKLAYKLFVKPTSKPDFVKDKIALFVIRDPRDILVSQYYSFGFNHSLNPVKEKRQRQILLRKEIQSLSIDDYALKYAEEQIENFNKLIELSTQCKESTLLKYEDLIDNFDYFIKKLRSVVVINDEALQEIYSKSRPKKVVDNKSHRRSGSTRRFEKDLKEETITLLNRKLRSILEHFEYRI